MIRTIRSFLLLCCLLTYYLSVSGQFIRQYPLPAPYFEQSIRNAIQTQDGGYMLIGDARFGGAAHVYLTKVDFEGNMQWRRIFDDAPFFNLELSAIKVFQRNDGGYLAAGFGDIPGHGAETFFVIRTDAAGNLLSHNFAATGFYWMFGSGMLTRPNLIRTQEGGFAAAGGSLNPHIALFDSNAQFIQSHYHEISGHQYPQAAYQTDDGGFTVCSTHGDENSIGPDYYNAMLTHFDTAGNAIWSDSLALAGERIDPEAMIRGLDGNYAVVGFGVDSTTGYGHGCFVLCDQQGSRILKQELPYTFFTSIAVTPDSGYVMAGYSIDSLRIVKTDRLGNLEWHNKIWVHPNYWSPMGDVSIAPTDFGGYLLTCLVTQGPPSNFPAPVFLVTDSLGRVPIDTVRGKLYWDDIQNCLYDSSETLMPQTLIKFTELGSGGTSYATTDSMGNYEISLHPGNYVAEPILPSPYMSWVCDPDTLSLPSTGEDTTDFPLYITDTCYYNEVSISSSPIAFNTATQISVQVCNNGTAPSFNTMAEVVLDPDLAFVVSFPPPSQINGQHLWYDLDSLQALECVSISLQAQLDTNTLAFSTHCIEANVYPNANCLQPAWAGAHIEATATCQNDSVIFSLTNTGRDMVLARTYMVYIDDVIFRTGTFDLDSGQVVDIIEPADTGATYRIEAMQEPGFPSYLGDSLAIAFYEGCFPYPDGSYHTGFVTQYYVGNSAHSEAILCQQNVASWDPNDKLAQPTGYGPNHIVAPETPIDYTIRFQNTGNDTARRVIILDTLSADLDIRSIQFGASSHPYTLHMIGQGILRFTFQPIILPDSNVNEPASHGFLNFRIRPKAEIPIGSRIENQAGIYFDYNPPVITPAVFHTIGLDFVPWTLVSAPDPIPNTATVKVWPNPVEDLVKFELENSSIEHLEVRIFDTKGSLVQQSEAQHTNHLTLSPQPWAEGIYFYQVWGNGQLIGTGKLWFRR